MLPPVGQPRKSWITRCHVKFMVITGQHMRVTDIGSEISQLWIRDWH